MRRCGEDEHASDVRTRTHLRFVAAHDPLDRGVLSEHRQPGRTDSRPSNRAARDRGVLCLSVPLAAGASDTPVAVQGALGDLLRTGSA